MEIKQYQTIRKLVEKMSLYDTELKLSGAFNHQYQINHTLAEKQIVAIEGEIQQQLPESYRNYLLQIGDGGAGPAGGILPLNDLIQYQFTIASCIHGGRVILNIEDGTISYLNGDQMAGEPVDFMAWYLDWIEESYFEGGLIAYLGEEAVRVAQAGDIAAALELFQLAMAIEPRDHFEIREDVYGEYLKIFCNVLYFLQRDNTGVPVNHELNHYFLEKALPKGPENPAIYFNAACVYNEMEAYQDVVHCILMAQKHYDQYSEMMAVIKEESLFEKFREAVDFEWGV